MTREEVIKELEILKEDYWDDDGYGHETKQYDDTMLALDMAIKALEQEPCEDAISRKAAIEAVGYCRTPTTIKGRIQALPSVQPKQIECGDTISRKWIKEAIHNFYQGLNHVPTEEDIQRYIEVAPSVNPQPKTGHWIDHYDEDAKVGWYECDRCHTERAFNTDYCPDCGAKMVEPQESEDKE